MTYLDDALNRIVALEKEIIAGCDAVPYFSYEQEAFPYWINRVGPFSVSQQSQQFFVYTYQIMMRLVIGHVTEGYRGELEQTLQTTYIPQTLDYFSQRINLQSAAYPTIMQFLDPRGVIVLNGTGLAIFGDSGIGTKQIGTEFTLELPIEVMLDQVY